ncbi:hypothetical protein F3J34_15120 [Klebsiella sp. Ap-873]|nr:hypothetical protein [Klebsiella sp. Ap-873]
MAKFKIGDLVRHVTYAGPQMVVLSAIQLFDDNNNSFQGYNCEYWSEVQSQFIERNFLEPSLVAVN